MKTAVFEVDFDPDMMWDEDSAVKEHGSYLKAMQWLFEQDGMGIFVEEPRLVDIKDRLQHIITRVEGGTK